MFLGKHGCVVFAGQREAVPKSAGDPRGVWFVLVQHAKGNGGVFFHGTHAVCFYFGEDTLFCFFFWGGPLKKDTPK